jgi:hypothetical protein
MRGEIKAATISFQSTHFNFGEDDVLRHYKKRFSWKVFELLKRGQAASNEASPCNHEGGANYPGCR